MRKKILRIIVSWILAYPSVVFLLFFTFRYHANGWSWFGFLEFAFNPLHFFLATIYYTVVCCMIDIIILWKRNHLPKRPSTCYSYILKSLKKLQAPFQEQIKHLRAQDISDLPHSFIKTWGHIGHYVKVTYEGQLIGEEVKTILEQIASSFIKFSPAGEEHCPEFWTPEAMKFHSFWKEMRALAAKAIALLEPQSDKSAQVFSK